MRWIDIIRISLKILRTNLLRTILTMLAIATAIGLIVILVGIGYGVQDVTVGQIIRSQSLLSLDVSAGQNDQPPITNNLLTDFKTLPGVKDLSPVLTADGQVQYGSKLISNSLLLVQKNYLAMAGIEIAKGREFENGTNEVLLSPQAVQLLDTTPDKILNQKLALSFIVTDTQTRRTISQPLTVVGITTSDSTEIYAPYSLTVSMSDIVPTSIKVVAADRNGVVTAQDALQSRGFAVDSLIDTLDQARRVFSWVTLVLVIIAVIALVVAAIGMFNTLTITLLERTREIGIMKAVGITDKVVNRLFLTEAALIGFGGGMIGVLAGTSVSSIIDIIFQQLAIHNGATPFQVILYPPWFLVSMIAYPVILSLITGIYPASRAARLNPLAALRYE